jgi:hypothetical protein
VELQLNEDLQVLKSLQLCVMARTGVEWKPDRVAVAALTFAIWRRTKTMHIQNIRLVEKHGDKGEQLLMINLSG